jgi:MYXO-CTERM domain-containing protein
MPEDDPGPPERSRAFVGLMGVAALLAWFALLWFMFGDVL